MIVRICFVLIVFGTVYGSFGGKTDDILQMLLSAPSECVQLILRIGGPICFFSGLMRVAQKSGLIDRFSERLTRPIGFLIPKTKTDSQLRLSVTMNLASNFFGLGNAATPFGIKAASKMATGKFSRSLAVFMILNTCSVQLIPTTVLSLRQASGSLNPTEILPAVWIVQILSCAFGVLLTRAVFRRDS